MKDIKDMTPIELKAYKDEHRFDEVEAAVGKEAADALRKLYDFYDKDKLIDWIAGLYDPEAGAFYYSNSARDYEPFRADVESTRQATSLIASSGGMESRNCLPSDIKKKILAFVNAMQSPIDGYFYHSQWPKGKNNLNTDRYGRDISSALGLINDLHIDADGDGIEEQQYPLYCAPNGTKCKRHRGTDECCAFPLIDPALAPEYLPESEPVIKAAPQKSGMHPDYSSREAFAAWLDVFNGTVKEDSGNAHKLSAISGEIRNHGYADIVLDQLDRAQAEVYEEQIAAGIEPTGLWQRHVNYKAVWGLLKFSSYYNNPKMGRRIDIKYVPHIVKTCIKVIESPPDGNYFANDMFNQWLGITRIMENVKRYYGDEGLELIYGIVRENLASLIDNSLEKIKYFKREDGSFSYKPSGNSLPKIYGTPISHGAIEGDMNAVALICVMYEAIYTCVGCPMVPLFTREDGDRFVSIIQNKKPIVKLPEKED